MDEPAFDPAAKERELREQSSAWDTSRQVMGAEADIPIVDVEEYFATGSDEALGAAAAALNEACESVGFFQLVGHSIEPAQIASMFAMVRSFHALPIETKQRIRMDQPDWPLGGSGYLPVRSRKLPSRDTDNLNEAFLVKAQHGVGFDDNRWPADVDLPGFRSIVESYANAINALALRLLPIYASALGLDADFFDDAFDDPTWRLRMTHYPPDLAASSGEFGIAPHVDTTFCTLLLQDAPGLMIFSHQRDEWIQAPVIENAFVVNSGELLKQWTNDRYLSVRHFANNDAQASRYSIPFFYNANADHLMACLASCHDDEHPPKYPAISYNQSQAVAQGE